MMLWFILFDLPFSLIWPIEIVLYTVCYLYVLLMSKLAIVL